MPEENYGAAILLILLSSACIALSSFFGKQLVLTLALPVTMILRFLFPAIILWWFALISKIPSLNRKFIIHHFIRASFGVISQYALFYYLQYGSILDATLLFMTSPLFVPLLLMISRSVSIQKIQWFSIAAGFVGVAFILKPGYGILDWHALIGLLSGLFNAASQVYFHKIARRSDTNSATLYAYTFSTLLAIIPALFFWRLIGGFLLQFAAHPNASLVLLLIILAVTGISNKALRARAFKKVKNANLLTPFLYSAIIFSGLIDWLVYDITPDYLSILGAIFIIGSGILLYFNKPSDLKEGL